LPSLSRETTYSTKVISPLTDLLLGKALVLEPQEKRILRTGGLDPEHLYL